MLSKELSRLHRKRFLGIFYSQVNLVSKISVKNGTIRKSSSFFFFISKYIDLMEILILKIEGQVTKSKI